MTSCFWPSEPCNCKGWHGASGGSAGFSPDTTNACPRASWRGGEKRAAPKDWAGVSSPDYTHLIEEARREMNAPPCVECGRPCLPGMRWCSTACFYEEDGYPTTPWTYPARDEEDDV